jgi:hypothetical protein
MLKHTSRLLKKCSALQPKALLLTMGSRAGVFDDAHAPYGAWAVRKRARASSESGW